MNARFGGLLGNVLGQLQVHSSGGALFRGKANRFTNLGGNGVGVADLASVFGKRPHQIYHIQNLEQPPCLEDLMGFWPEIIIMGMPPSWA